MAISLIPTNEPCPRCGVNKVQRRRETPTWGSQSIVKISPPFCAAGCTRQQLDEFEREQRGDA
jgi:hypothetical protein